MSVINQMLHDLESRHGTPQGSAVLSEQIRAVPVRSSGHPASWALLWLGIAMLVVGLVWMVLPRGPGTRLQPSAIMAPGSMPNLALNASVRKAPAPAVATSTPTAPVPREEARAALESVAATVATTAPPLRFRLKPTLSLGLPRASSMPTGAQQTSKLSTLSESTPVPTPTPDSVAEVMPAERDLRSTPMLAPPIKEITPKQRAENDYARALTLLQEERTAEATELLGTVLQQEPSHSAARQTLVAELVAAKQYTEAVRRLQDGLKLDPAHSDFAMLLARLQVEQGDVAAALTTLQRGLPAAGERADYQAFLAALLQRESRHKEAIDHYQRALRKSPAVGAWLTGLAISLQAENRTTEALDAFERARRIGNLSPDLKVFVEQQLQRAGR